MCESSFSHRYFKWNRNLLFVIIFLNFFVTVNIRAQQSSQPEAGLMAGQAEKMFIPVESGLLFYLSGNKEFSADFAAGGQVLPNFLKDVSIIPQGAKGAGFMAEDNQLMSYWAPGNIYAQRGTISFYWRSRYPVGPTPFPIFRVGYADHSSWDMVWLRIDYNGSGFDAFVTDIGLARTRISYYMDRFPGPEEWIHLALSWDETEGIKFYIDGKLVAKQSITGSVFDSGLDQFGPHSRIISPYQVQSAYCFMRGGDLDELRIYDRMLPDEYISNLVEGKNNKALLPLERNLNERRWRDAWWLRHGWNLPNEPPPLLPSLETSVRKVEIHEAVDIKRWYWKANDGIRETTWPGVYNMSRLPGRYDYFVLPDWDCYSGSGQSVKFDLPEEPWNHVEIWGKAWGQLTLERDLKRDNTFGVRSQNQIKSWHRLENVQQGGKIRFDNALIEEPIGSFEVYHIDKGKAPAGIFSENFTLIPTGDEFNFKPLKDIASFVKGRYPVDERDFMLGILDGTSNINNENPDSAYSYPFIHILIPYINHPEAGLDGIEVQLPSMHVIPTHDGCFPMNVRVKDPLWLMRDMADFSFSVKPGEAPLLWIDTRDRILPENRALYITVAGAGPDLNSNLLKGTKIRLVYKSRDKALPEHEIDRFTQIRDLYAHIVEEGPKNSRFNLYNRFIADCDDLLAVNPDHWLAQTYRYALTSENKPEYKIPACPEGIPKWAWLQIEYLRHLERISTYYIDQRQIQNGEFGGGLSDDGDLTNMWPGIAFLGINPEKILGSLQQHMAAYYDQDRPAYYSTLRQKSLPLFTNGLATILTDELHSLEEGIQVVSQLILMDYGTPLHLERGMETAMRLIEDITQINPEGHRHFRSRYYGGTNIAVEDPWQWSVNRSYHVLQPAYLIARYNGNPRLVRMITELADALLEHYQNNTFYTEIHFTSDKHRGDTGNVTKPWALFYAAYALTGDNKYLKYIPDKAADTKVFNEERLIKRYSEEIINLGVREYINTEGSIWIDRISPFSPAIQEDRLGGVALLRTNVLYPQHFVSWNFKAPANYESVAIFIPKADRANIDIIAYNIDHVSVSAEMTAWDVNPGKWRVLQGIDLNDDQIMDTEITERIIELERGETLNFIFTPHEYNIVSMQLVDPEEKGYQDRPDLGIGADDVLISGNQVKVRIHSLGSVATPETILELRDAAGKLVATAQVPGLDAPVDLLPSLTEVIIDTPSGTNLSSGSIQIDPEKKIKQITRRNTLVKW